MFAEIEDAAYLEWEDDLHPILIFHPVEKVVSMHGYLKQMGRISILEVSF